MYLNSLLNLRIEGRNVETTDKELVTLYTELINAGTETTTTAIEWAMERVVVNPFIKAWLHEEIIQQVDDVQSIDDKDTNSMLYLQAFIKEFLRKHPPT